MNRFLYVDSIDDLSHTAAVIACRWLLQTTELMRSSSVLVFRSGTLNVVSNVPFVLVGVAGAILLGRGGLPGARRSLRPLYGTLFVSTALVGLGTAIASGNPIGVLNAVRDTVRSVHTG